MKNILLVTFIFYYFSQAAAQQVYFDFEEIKAVNFGHSTGKLDTTETNPDPNTENNSANCAKYIRDTAIYDFIKLYPHTKLADVSSYASSDPSAPKIEMKLYSGAPVGTPVQIQLGIRSVDNYPAGIHSEYLGITSKINEWETVTFNFMYIPPGSLVSSTDIDKVVILFRPGSSTRDTIFFDELSGPPLTAVSVPRMEGFPFKLYQNSPNPAGGQTDISFYLSTPGEVSLEIYNLIGKRVYLFTPREMRAGMHTIPVETENIPNGIYIYVLKKDGHSRSMKMTVAK